MATLRGRSLAYQPVLVEPGDAYLAQLAFLIEGAEGRAPIDALVFVDFGASLPLAVVDAHMNFGAFADGLDAHSEIGDSGNQSQTFREEWRDHTVAVDRLLKSEPGHLVQTEHDRNAVSRLHIQRGVFEAQRQVLIEAGVGRRPHVRREPHAHAVREPRLDVQVAARHVERVVAVRVVQLRCILKERGNTERHRWKGSGSGRDHLSRG